MVKQSRCIKWWNSLRYIKSCNDYVALSGVTNALSGETVTLSGVTVSVMVSMTIDSHLTRKVHYKKLDFQWRLNILSLKIQFQWQL